MNHTQLNKAKQSKRCRANGLLLNEDQNSALFDLQQAYTSTTNLSNEKSLDKLHNWWEQSKGMEKGVFKGRCGWKIESNHLQWLFQVKWSNLFQFLILHIKFAAKFAVHTYGTLASIIPANFRFVVFVFSMVREPNQNRFARSIARILRFAEEQIALIKWQNNNVVFVYLNCWSSMPPLPHHHHCRRRCHHHHHHRHCRCHFQRHTQSNEVKGNGAI